MTPRPRTLLIVWHSLTGGTHSMARAAAAGATAATARLLNARDAGPDDVLAADGLVFATPETLASMAGGMKDFFDRTYYPVLDRINGRPYAAMVCAGTDGQGAARQIARIAAGWRLRAVAPPLIVLTGAQSPEAILAPKTVPESELGRCSDLGAAMAEGITLGIF